MAKQTLWGAINRARGMLIDANIEGRLSPQEDALLTAMQVYADHYLGNFRHQGSLDTFGRADDFVVLQFGERWALIEIGSSLESN